MRTLIGLLLLVLQVVPTLASEPIVATHYFYWYRWPDQHFNQPGAPGNEGHFHHLPNPETVSYLSEAWHEAQLRAMKSAEIDIALPVYWGAPGAYERPGVRFSRDGLAPMVSAAKKLGDDGVRLGLFYDTSTLLNDVRGVPPGGGKADLTTPEGLGLFTRTVVEYFEMVPKELWGRMHSRPLVVLYSGSFAARWDTGLGDALRAAFGARFPGESVFLVADKSWGKIGQDRTTSWGAALWGPQLFSGVAQIGPGYDDSPVPRRKTPHREREAGDYYRYSWQQALKHRPELVLIETWNEMHEGTEICETIETGKLYLELTAEWSRKLKKTQDPGPAISLRWPEPRNRPDLGWGDDAAGRAGVSADYSTPPSKHVGIRVRAEQDGPVQRRPGSLRSPGQLNRYLYFQVSDHWIFEAPETPTQDLRLTVRTRKATRFSVEYDSHDRRATFRGAYTRVDPVEPAGKKATGMSHRFQLPAAFFGNRQNGGSDFRLALTGPDVDVVFVSLDRGK